MTTVSTLPPAPNRNSPSDFSTKADAWVAAIGTWTTEVNTVAGEVNTNASTASTAASTATTQANNASTSATTASNWAIKTDGPVSGGEYSAKYHAQQAATSASSALTSKNEAEAIVEKYQGALSSDPTLDKTGGPITAGDWYVNTTTGLIRAYNGTAWVNSTNVSSGVASINGETGTVTGYVKETGAQNISDKTFSNTTVNGGNLNDNTINGPRYTIDNDGTISGGTWAIDYANGPLIKATVGAAITSITLSNLPASGTLGHLKLMLVNPGAFAITFPAAWKFIKSDFTTTNFAGLGVTLPASGVVFFDLITDDAGSNVYVTISRN